MKFCTLQTKMISEKSLKSHNDCKQQTDMNMQTCDELDVLKQSVENHNVFTNLSVDQATT